MKDYEEKVLNIMDNTKVNIIAQLNRAYKSGYEDAKSELGKNIINLTHEERDIAYQQGLEDAWEVVQNITKEEDKGGYSVEMLKDIFGYFYIYDIFQRYAPQDVIRMIKEYEEEQKQDAEIKVWDEVYSEMNDLRFIVTRIITSKHMDITVKRYEGICTDGACYDNLPEDIVKTGRTFPQISEVLEKMRGEKE